MAIQWFPGHMAKARREIKEMIKLVDLVIELRDARIPQSSKNPMVDEIVSNKPRLILLNKSSLADGVETQKWINYLTNNNTLCLDIDCITNLNINKISSYAKEALKEVFEKRKEKLIRNAQIRAVILGIPNVGKSTFINTLAKRKAVKVGNKPGVTKGQSWIKVNNDLLFLDTPGILWPKFEDQEVGVNLAICGSIKDEILDLSNICYKAVEYIKVYYTSLLVERYNLDDITNLSTEDIISQIAIKRGCLLKGNLIDYKRVENIIIDDIRQKRIGAISFERSDKYL